MTHAEPWIWLNKDLYPEDQHTLYNAHGDISKGRFAVAEFFREYEFPQTAVSARLRFSGDTLFQLYLNDALVATGPACVGGDFIGNETVRDNYYAFEVTVAPGSRRLGFFARVRMMPAQICDYSKGQGGFMLTGEVTLADGATVPVATGEDWLCRKNGAYTGPCSYDGRIGPDMWRPAQVTQDIWHALTAPIPPRSERELAPAGSCMELAPGESRKAVLDFDMIYAGFVRVRAEAAGEVRVRVHCREMAEEGSQEEAVFASAGEYRGFYMHSAGNLLVEAENLSDAPASVTVSFIDTHYPVTEEAHTVVSDPELNQVVKTCQHTLMICRQTHHLDGPTHCEPLACTGDYYIHTLMTLFSFGDMRLAEFDAVRTAVLLERENGRMFHTTYSCIWVRMIYDLYRITGHRALLERCAHALDLLLARFDTYMGDNGLIENPPDYMFVDWIYIDSISMHHPPKALGQTCLNLFYAGALEAAGHVYDALDRHQDADACRQKRKPLCQAINRLLYDPEKGMYFEGLNTPTPESLLGKWMPQNVAKRYYLKQSNVLACYFGVCDDDTGRSILAKVMDDTIPGDIQPYFIHFLLEAVFRLGLRDEYTLRILDKWKAPVRECPKGIAEGFVKPEPTYRFDHSHAWAGCAAYALPRALMGLTILEPGMTRIALSPTLMGLASAHVELLTPQGRITCEMTPDAPPAVTAPASVAIDCPMPIDLTTY